MASAFLKRHNLVTNSRHYLFPNGQNHSCSYNNNNYQMMYNHITNKGPHQQQQRMYFKYYSSRFSNAVRRRSGAAFGPTVSGFVGWYLGMIESRPILTKSLTSSFIYIVADLTSQTIALPSTEPYDLVRTSRMAGYGLVILGPTLHFWFNFMSKILPARDIPATVKKIALGQTVYGPFMNVIFFSLNAALQGEDGNEILARLKRDLIPTMVNGLMYWPLCDFITFRFTPVHLQPLVSNSFSYLWTVYITYMASLEKPSE